MNCKLYPPLFIHELGQRDNQEDAIAQWNNRLFVLCDGMGGHERGEVASQTVCQSLVKWFSENIKDDSFTDDQLLAALDNAYTELDRYDDGSTKKMGTTLTLLYIHAQGITAAHIGDSRIYHIRPMQGQTPPLRGEPKVAVPAQAGGKAIAGRGLLYQSRDHSLVFDLYQSGEITYEEMLTSPQKNIITRAMQPGEVNRVRPDIIHITDIQPDDWFFLCSDGMLESIENDELASLLTSEKDDEQKRQALISLTADNHDNHSAWLIHIKKVINEPGDETLPNEEPTARCNALNIIRQRREEDNDDVVIVEKMKKTKSLLQRMKDVVDVMMNKQK